MHAEKCSTKLNPKIMNLATTDEVVELQTYQNPFLMQGLRCIARQYNALFYSIYYPCSSADTSVADVFKLRKVIHADKSKSAITALKSKGYMYYLGDVESIKLRQTFDLIVLHNSGLSVQSLYIVLNKLRKGGYVVCTDHNFEASFINKTGCYMIEGVVERVKNHPTLADDSPRFEHLFNSDYFDNLNYSIAFEPSGNKNPGATDLYLFKKIS